jgi:hypothetical protein
MKPINLLAATTALVMAATPTYAANWVYVLTDGNGTVRYYDSDTIQRSGKWVTVWEKWDHSRDKTVKEREKKIRGTYDCVQRTSANLSAIFYYPDGKIKTFDFKDEQSPLAPETAGEATLEAVCAATAP